MAANIQISILFMVKLKSLSCLLFYHLDEKYINPLVILNFKTYNKQFFAVPVAWFGVWKHANKTVLGQLSFLTEHSFHYEVLV